MSREVARELCNFAGSMHNMQQTRNASMSSIMTVVQCWDDGVTTDARLTDILRRNNAKATFNLNAGLYEPERKFGWKYKDTEVFRMGWNEMREVYDGFTIANHSLTHPRLDQLPIDEARRDIIDGRDALEQFFGKTVRGFAYPFGAYNSAVMDAVRESGHIYARGVGDNDCPFPPEDPMAFQPCCHFLSPDFWGRYERARSGGVFYFWGHSYEMINEEMWADFESKIKRISTDPGSRWSDIADLFISKKTV